MSNKESNIEKTNFDAFIQAVGSEIEQAQVRLNCCSQCTNAVPLLEDRQLHPYHQQAATDGEAKSSSNWQRLSVSIILKRKAIRNATLPICVSLQRHIL